MHGAHCAYKNRPYTSCIATANNYSAHEKKNHTEETLQQRQILYSQEPKKHTLQAIQRITIK